MDSLLREIKSCKICESLLPHDPNPVLSVSLKSKILIIGQAPGQKVHNSGIPWHDQSGDTLRDWLSVSDEVFYNPDIIGLVPMGFCYPGKGKSGDLPPRPECYDTWHSKLMTGLSDVRLTLLVGNYAQSKYLGTEAKNTLTETVLNFKKYLPDTIPLPHPSPRNRFWLSKNPWFNEELIPVLKNRVSDIIKDNSVI